MKILYVVNAELEPRLAAAHFADRFHQGPIEVDIVGVMVAQEAGATRPSPLARGGLRVVRRQSHNGSNQQAEAMRAALESLDCVGEIRTHIISDFSAEAIAAKSSELASDLVMLEAGMPAVLEHLNPVSLTNRLLRLVPCSLELIKPYAANPRSHFNVLVPIDVHQIQDFPLTQLGAMSWPKNTHLHLLGLAAPSNKPMPTEANPCRILEDISTRCALHSRSRALLGEARTALANTSQSDIEIEVSVIEDNDSDSILKEASRLRASLLVTHSPAATGKPKPYAFLDWLARGLDADLSLRSACSVMVLRTNDAKENRSEAAITRS